MSAQSSEAFSERVQRAALNRWKLETWTKMLGVRSLDRAQKMSERNQEAENRRIRQQLWGNDGGSDEGDEMGGNTYLGDVTTPAPVIVAGGGNSSLGPLLAAALGALGPAGAVGGFFLNQMLQQHPAAQVAPATNERPATVQKETVIKEPEMVFELLQESDLLPPLPAP